MVLARIDSVGRPGGASLPWRGIALCIAALLAIQAQAAEVIPPKPDRYFNDYASVVTPEAALRFNEQLAQLERDTSNQVVVAVFPKMESGSSVEDYGQRIAQSWGVGQKAQRNGVVLLVFIGDRKISLQVGYGLEGVLPDATAHDIRVNRITPLFRQGNYEGGLAAGIEAIAQAIKGEYRGTGKTIQEGERRSGPGDNIVFWIICAIFVIMFIRSLTRKKKRGYRYSSSGGPFIGGWSGGSGGGWSSGSSGGGFSGFSGGGGSFGGGGSSGSW